MKHLISPAAMRACEEKYFAESGVKSIDVMERAAQALADVIRAEIPEGSSIYFACGTGGNGGDGTACARLLHEKYHCTIFQLKQPKSADAIENLRRAKECGIEIRTEVPEDLPDEVPDAWVDALFGTGLSREPDDEYAALFFQMTADRSSGAKVFAADIPSGLNGATGKAYEHCVYADHTVTFQYIKTGIVLGDGLDACGKITVADVGFPMDAFFSEIKTTHLLEPSDVKHFLPPRFRNIHKGNCGHLLIIAGSFGMAGAAAMCAKAALRSGVGLLTIACVKSIVPILQTLVPQAMCIPLEEENGAISIKARPDALSALSGKTAVVIGPGLTTNVPDEIIYDVLLKEIPAVIDADALNIMSNNPNLMKRLQKYHIITPHPGEASRLLSSADMFRHLLDKSAPDANLKQLVAAFRSALANIALSDSYPPAPPSSPIEAATALQSLGATALYKGASCVIADGEQVYISRSGCCGMARGGSGDILCGIMGALLAEKSILSSALIAALASEIHGLAGELAQQKYGSRSMNAMDIIEFLPEVFPK